MVDVIAAEYEKLGCHVDFVDIMTGHFGEELIDKLKHNRFDAAFSSNCIGEAEVRFADGENVYDHFGVPFVEFIGDHPIDHFKHIIKSGKQFYLTYVNWREVENLHKRIILFRLWQRNNWKLPTV